mmetsp:Transcript_24954/g.73290  ORF Transcript_24954/g.73290 Transcript_24954/m.73290 type:complete len:372 (+) Transcript_24954:604-1719(+)
MLREVKVAARSTPFQLLHAEGELEHDVGAGARVVRQLLRGVVVHGEQLGEDADAHVPVEARLHPGLVLRAPLILHVSRPHKVLELHLLELTRAEYEVARGDLVAEGLADLGDSEGHLHARRRHHVLKVGEDALRRFRPEVGCGRGVSHGAHLGLKHEVEVAGLGEGTGCARSGRGNLGTLLRRRLGELRELSHFGLLARAQLHARLLQEGLGLLRRVRGHVARLENADEAHYLARALRRVVRHRHGGVEELVRAESLLALLAVHHWVGETGDVARRLPRLGAGNDRRVEAHDVIAPVHHVLPPCALDVVTQLHPQWPEVEEACETRVNVRRRVDDATALAEGDDVVHVHIRVHERLQVDGARGRRRGLRGG